MSFSASGRKVRNHAYLAATSGVLRSVLFDVSEQESHKSTAKVTDHPVESGANVADHVVIQPEALSLVAWVSNTPIVSQDVAATLHPARAEEAHDALLSMKNAGATCKVVTTLRTYKNMVITSVAVSRDKSTGEALAVSIDLQEVRTATSEAIEAPQPRADVRARATAAKDDGLKTTQDAPPAIDAKAKTNLLGFTRRYSSNVARLTQ